MSNEIKINQNGPIIVSGVATYVDKEGNEKKTPGTAFALCRCGESSNKPFCDGSHNKVGFEATEIVLVLKD